MAVKLLQVLLLGVIAAAADDDVPVSWVSSPRAALQCQIPDAERIPARRSPPPLIEADDRARSKPYLWRRGDVELKRVSHNGTLEVFRRKDNEEVYQCSVKHQTGYVLGYPLLLKFAYLEKQFSVQPANATAWRGQPYVLTCDILSGPSASISWLKDGKLVSVDSERYYLLNNQLLITSVTDSDAGLYRCRATNSIVNKSRTSHGGRLQVEDSPVDLPPSFLPVIYETNVTVQRGSTVTLPCPVLSDRKVELKWELTPPSLPGLPNSLVRTSELENTGEFHVLQNIQLEDEGIYTCKVEGHSHLVKTFNVTVTVPVNITDPPKSKHSVRAGTVRFNCTASGKPPPKVTWYKDGKILKLAGRIDVVISAEDKKSPQLLIRSVTSEDAGIYQCFAQNSISVASSWATLNVTGAEAEAPSALKCLPTGARDVLVKWTEVPLDVVAYIVMTTDPGGNSLPGQPVQDTEAPISVKSPLTPYGFQVRAFIRSTSVSKNTANVVSDISEKVTCQGQGVPIKLTKVEDDSILVSWRNFYEENPKVLQWILQYKTENGTDEHTNVTLDGYFYNYTLNVSPSEPLQVRVLGTRSLPWLQQNLTLVPWTASSAAGHYSGSGDVRAIPEDVEVTEVNARNFTVRWRFEDDLMLKSYTYFVCTRRSGGNEECMNSTKSWAKVINLQPDSVYEVRVQARIPGQVLGGDFSGPIQIRTKTEGQGNSRELTYKFINTTAVRVSWNSDPREYTVRYTDDFNQPLTQWSAVNAIGNTVVISDLDPTKELHVMVEGPEPVGHSPMLKIPARIPVAKDLQYSYTRSGLTVTWKGEGPRVVRYSQNLTHNVDNWITINVSATSVELTGLDPARPTFVIIAAPGPSQHNQVLTISPRPADDNYNIYLWVGIGCGVLLLCLLVAAAFCIWQKRKRSRSPVRTRRRPSTVESTEDEGSEMKNIGGRLANGGGSKEAGEPLLNGHVHITENPSQSKTPNGKVRKGRYEPAFDVARYGDADATVETVLDDSTAFTLLDTSRQPEFEDRARELQDPYKLPDDNMNELTRPTPFPLENSKILPTLQPNG